MSAIPAIARPLPLSPVLAIFVSAMMPSTIAIGTNANNPKMKVRIANVLVPRRCPGWLPPGYGWKPCPGG